MSKISLFSLLSSSALALALVSPAGATTVTIGGLSIAGQGMKTAVAGTVTTDFNLLSNLSGTTFTAIGTTPTNPVVSGNLANLYSTPLNDTTNFLSTGKGVITDTLASGSTYFGFYWGSVDTYNTFTLSDSKGKTLTIGDSGVSSSSLGIGADGASSYFVNFYADPGATFTQATFTSSNFSFEFDNVATATPEPGTIAMLAGGLLIVAGTLRRRKA